MMKHIILKVAFVFSLNIACLVGYSQVAINTDGSPPDSSSILDVKSNSRGMIIPRMTKNRRESIASPATGLLVYQTNFAIGFYFNAGPPEAPKWRAIHRDPGEVTITKPAIALNQWFKTPIEFGLFDQPTALGFDGRYLWLTYPEVFSEDFSAGIPIQKIDPTYGKVVVTYYYNDYILNGVHGDITGIVFDGTNLWFAHNLTNTASKMNPLDGTVISYVGLGGGPTPIETKGIAFDGSAIWVAKNNIDYVSQIVGTIVTDVEVDHGATAIQFDGTYIWVVNNVSGTVTKITTSRTVIGTYITGGPPRAIAFDGSHLWITNSNNRITKLDPLTGSFVASHVLSFSPNDIVFDGTHMWVSDFNNNSVARINNEGTVVSTVPTNGLPKGIVFDGNYIWVYTDTQKLLKIPL